MRPLLPASLQALPTTSTAENQHGEGFTTTESLKLPPAVFLRRSAAKGKESPSSGLLQRGAIYV